MKARRLQNSCHVAQVALCGFALLLWSARSSCGISRQASERSFVTPQSHLQRLSLHVAPGTSEDRNKPPVSSKFAASPRVSCAAALSLLLSCAFCGQSHGLSKRLEIVRCRAGFQGSGLTGKWGCYKTEGDIDAYWKATGLPWLARKGLQLMDWGAGKNQNVREFLQNGDSIKMDYSFDGPGLGGLGFTETYTVGNGIQEITRMGGAKILVDPAWESDSILRVQNMNPAKQTKGWAKTLLSGGQDEETNKQMVDGETSNEERLGDVIDIHRFYLEDSSLVLEADSSPSGGPVVKWFLKKLS